MSGYKMGNTHWLRAVTRSATFLCAKAEGAKSLKSLLDVNAQWVGLMVLVRYAVAECPNRKEGDRLSDLADAMDSDFHDCFIKGQSQIGR